MKRIKLQSVASYGDLFLWVLLLGCIAYFSYSAYNKLVPHFACLLLFVLPFLIKILSPAKRYLAEILVYPRSLELVMKYRDKVVDRIEIKKQDIKEIFAEAHVDEIGGKIRDCVVHLKIDVGTENPYQFRIKPNQISLAEMFCSAYQPMLELVKYKELLPNFSYKVIGSDYAKKEIDYCALHKRKFSWFTSCNELWYSNAFMDKVRVFVGWLTTALLAFSVVVLLVCIIHNIMFP